MPIIDTTYKPPSWSKNGHVSTIYSGLLRHVTFSYKKRERIDLPDGDFMDLDWSFAQKESDELIILLHGLEGSSLRPYITGTAKLFNGKGIDAVGVNFRGCSGEPNPVSYTHL